MVFASKLSNLETIFSPCSDRLDYWARFIAEHDFACVAEIGVWKGEFAEDILRNCENIKQYIMVDPWRHMSNWNKPFNVDDDRFESVRDEALARTSFAADKIVEYRDTTINAMQHLADDALDFAYIDGDHTLRGIALDLMSVYPKVKEGGVIAGDDFTVTPWQHKAEFEPTLIFPYAVIFAEAMNVPIFALGSNQFAIVKRSVVGFKFVDLTNGHYSDLSLNSLLPSQA